MPKIASSTTTSFQRALLIGVELTGTKQNIPVGESLQELAQLASTAGLAVVGTLKQRLAKPNRATYIGSGKLVELVGLIQETAAELVVFDSELSP